MADVWKARHSGGATTTLTGQQVRDRAREAGIEAVWIGYGEVRVGDWTMTLEKRS